jgi:MFS family permease
MTPTQTAAADGYVDLPARPAAGLAEEEATYRRVTRRILPLMMICYIVAYLDRVNVGFAKLQMMADLHLSNTAYGIGAGLFFIGYFFCEVPSNLALHRFGAKRWIARIMITWGLISGCFMFVSNTNVFYLLRFLLGAAEAGFYPGILLYLTYWFPSARRGRIMAMFMAAIPMAMVLGAPISGWIMDSFHNVNGLDGWQWMFLLEATPAVLLGIYVFFRLDNGIQDAKWLSPSEKAMLAERIAQDNGAKHSHGSLKMVFKDKRLLVMGLIYFSCAMSQTGLGLWIPTLVAKLGFKTLATVGLVSAVPYLLAAICMYFVGSHADAQRERRWHFAVPAFFGALGLFAIPFAADSTVLTALAITVGAIGAVTASAMFWSIPTAIFGGASAAATLAVINSLGNLGGFVGPFIVGWLVDLTSSTNAGMTALSLVLVGGGLLALAAVRPSEVDK